MGPLLITGAGGRLGRALCALPGVVGLDRAGLDIAGADAARNRLAALGPRAVINAAALAQVDACETDWDRAWSANALGPGVLADACAEAGVPLVHVSTDYVFGAEGHARPRAEDDPPAPVNAYGRSKRAGEERVLAAGGSACVVRTAWIFGFPGDFLDRMRGKARAEGRLAVTEQAGTPTPVGPLAQGLVRIADALAAGRAMPPVLHLAGAPVTTRADWVAAALAATPDLAATPLSRVGLHAFAGDAAARPVGTPLDTTLYQSLFGPAPDWRTAVAAQAGADSV